MYVRSINVSTIVTFSFYLSLARHQKQIGSFAYTHIDRWDSAGAVTSLVFCSDLPENYNSGVIFFLEIGMIAPLAQTGCINFCGLYRHGGRPPTPIRPEHEVADWLYRLVIVHYPYAVPLDGGAVISVIPLPCGRSSQMFLIRPGLQLLRFDSLLLYKLKVSHFSLIAQKDCLFLIWSLRHLLQME